MGLGRNGVSMPDHFVDSLRILFDILDVDRTGFVSYQQFCAHWRDLPSPQLPSSFLDCLGRVTPPSGLFSFERFIAAVRASLEQQRAMLTQSDGKIAELSVDKKRGGPTMGLNGLDRRSAHIGQTAVTSDNANYNNNCESVRMRAKKNLSKAPQKDGNSQDAQRSSYIRFRPLSTNSYASLGTTSSGMTDVRWRNSQVCSSPSTASSQQTVHDSPHSARHEALLEEEKEVLSRGIENAKRILSWYAERLATLEKRQRLLSKGMVALETAVHEQKLNYLRAHVTELNRRMVSLMESSEHGFPTHANLQVRTQLPQPDDDRSQYLHRQNKKLSQELVDKDRIIEALKKERAEAVDISHHTVRRIQPHRNPATISARPAALVRPAPHHQAGRPNAYPHAASPVKVHDTLM